MANSSTTKDLKNLAQAKQISEEIILNSYLTVKIVSVKKPVSYKSSQGEDKTFMEIIVADTTDFMKALVYDHEKYPILQTDEVVIMNDCIKKEDNTLIITTKSNLFTSSRNAVEVPEEILNAAVKGKDTTTVDVVTAATSPIKTPVSVTGKVVIASEPVVKKRKSSGEDISFKRLKVKDDSGSVNIALWRDLSTSPVKVGTYVKLTNFVRTSTFDRKTQGQKPVLGSSTNSSIEFLPLPEDDNISMSSDSEDNESLNQCGQLVGIEYIDIYRCCIQEKCFKKKVYPEKGMQCDKCNVTYSQGSAGYGAIGKILIKKVDSFEVFTMFTQHFEQLLKSMAKKTSFETSAELIAHLKPHLPITIKYTNNGNKISTISAINFTQ